MKIVALIPARKGSKRIKRKNLRNLVGKPLIDWTIKTAKKVKNINSIFVSTDDEQIIKYCKKKNINVPWKRPKSLSGDKVNSVSVALHFLNWYEKKYSKIDGLLLLQPTSPFRKKSSIIKAIKLFKKNKNKAIVSFSRIKKKNRINGSIYLISSKNIRKHKSFFKPTVLPLVQNNLKESIDIDTYDDWKIAEKLKL